MIFVCLLGSVTGNASTDNFKLSFFFLFFFFFFSLPLFFRFSIFVRVDTGLITMALHASTFVMVVHMSLMMVLTIHIYQYFHVSGS